MSLEKKKRFKCREPSCNGMKTSKRGPCNNQHCPKKVAAIAGDKEEEEEMEVEEEEEEEAGGVTEEDMFTEEEAADDAITDDAIEDQKRRVDQMRNTHQTNLRLLYKQPPTFTPPQRDANTDAMDYSELMIQKMADYEAHLGEFKVQLQRAREQAHRSQLALKKDEARLDNMRELSDAIKLLTAAEKNKLTQTEAIFTAIKATNMDFASPRVTRAKEGYHKAEAEAHRLQSKVEEAREKLCSNVARL